MGSRGSVGVSDISLYVPAPRIEQRKVVERRVLDNPRLARHLERACSVTGQRAIRFPEPWEDSVTMGAQAALELLSRVPPGGVAALRHLVAGTETGVDHSKPVSAYIQGALERAGAGVPRRVSSFQVQHACAGGTLGLLSVGGLLAAGGRDGESGLVVSTDIARYQTETTAEVTQGAGATALHVALSPRLLELDLSSVGTWSVDVDDFFRPLGSAVPQVRGTYSMQCYWDGLEAALGEHCARTGETLEAALRGTDLFALHTPFRNMPGTAMERLLQRVLGLDTREAHAFLDARGFYAAVDPIAEIGNMYSASLWAVLALLLEDRYRVLGSGIVGRRVLLASYGSGSTMMVLAGTVADSAPEVISRWDLGPLRGAARAAGFDEYAAWAAGPRDGDDYGRIIEQADVPPRAFFLAAIRPDGYREYRQGREMGELRELRRSLAARR